MTLPSHTLPLALVLLVSASPAAAVENLTGTWEGTLKCRVLNGTTVQKTKAPVTLEIIDSGVGGVQAELVSTDSTFVGFVVAESAGAPKGVLASATCGFAFDDLDGGTLQADVKTKAGSEKASIKGHVAFMGVGQGTTRVCTIAAKRTSAVEPDIIGCAL
jgi:hypothetical protein